jgi:hypothetical protein
LRPEIFPTPNGTIQLGYERPSGEYLGIEVVPPGELMDVFYSFADDIEAYGIFTFTVENVMRLVDFLKEENNKMIGYSDIGSGRVKYEVTVSDVGYGEPYYVYYPTYTYGGVYPSDAHGRVCPSEISRVVYNNPAVIILWKDGSKRLK